MSLFNFSDGQNATQTDGNFDGGGDFELIPKGTQLLAYIDEAKWDTVQDADRDGANIISLRWTVAKPDTYKNRKIFQKLKVENPKESAADRAKKMFFAIDKNCGGKIAASGKQPGDMELMASLCNKPMVIKLDVWEMDDKSGNWVSAVSAAKNAGAVQPQTPPPPPAPAANFDDIPF